MKSTSRAAVGAVGLCLPLVAAATVLPASADPHPRPIVVDELTPRSTFTDDVTLRLKVKDDHGSRKARLPDPSLTTVARITVQPGARFPLHHHPGPVIVNVASGELTYVDEDCGEHVYPAGKAFVDTGTDVHSAFGSSRVPTVLYATFLGAPPLPGKLTIPEAVSDPCRDLTSTPSPSRQRNRT